MCIAQFVVHIANICVNYYYYREFCGPIFINKTVNLFNCFFFCFCSNLYCSEEKILFLSLMHNTVRIQAARQIFCRLFVKPSFVEQSDRKKLLLIKHLALVSYINYAVFSFVVTHFRKKWHAIKITCLFVTCFIWENQLLLWHIVSAPFKWHIFTRVTVKISIHSFLFIWTGTKPRTKPQ